jgi:hypothetical protein
MLEEIKTDLGANFKTGDDSILTKYINDLTVIALSISNKATLDAGVTYFVKEAVKSAYLKRGNEGTSSSSEGSLSSSYLDIKEEMRNNIIKSSLRILR